MVFDIYLFLKGNILMGNNTFIKNAKEALSLKPFQTSNVSSIEQRKQSGRLMRFILVSASVCFVALEPSIVSAGGVAATTSTTAGGLQTMVTNIVSVLTGTFGKGIATIAIMAMGIMAMFGKLEWATAVKVIIGIAVTFGAASIVTWLTGGTAFDSISYLMIPATYLA